MQMPSFMIPAGETSIASPQEVERKRLIALALMRQGMDTGPTDMWGGVARLGQSVVGALMNKKADRQEQAGRDDANQNFTAIMERLMGPSSATAAPAGGNFNAEVQASPYEAQGVPDPRSPEFNVIDDRELPVDPRYIQAQPQGQQPQPAQPQGNEFAQMDQLPMGEIIGLLNNPYLQPGQAQFLQSFVQNKMDTGEWQSAGGGVIFNNRTGEKMQVGPVEPTKAPQIETFFDENTGQQYKAQWDAESGEWQPIGGRKAESNGVTIGPDGTVQIGGQKTTEGDRRAILLANQTISQEQTVMDSFDSLASVQNTAAANIPGGRYFMTPEGQAAQDALSNVIGNWLYLTSGATAPAEEVAKRTKEVTPTALDDPKTVELKKARLKSIFDGMKQRAGIQTAPAAPAQIGGYTIEQVD
jgi:hypothetical protein